MILELEDLNCPFCNAKLITGVGIAYWCSMKTTACFGFRYYTANKTYLCDGVDYSHEEFAKLLKLKAFW